MIFLSALLLATCALTTAYERCTENGLNGACLRLRDCMTAREGIKYGKYPKFCRYAVFDPIVCCFDNISTTTTPHPTIDSVSMPGDDDNYDDNDEDEDNSCPPILQNLTAPRTGRKAWDKCLAYQEKLVYPCEKSVGLSYGAPMVRKNTCYLDVLPLILGGTDAVRNEFPHMALLGYGDYKDTQWLCGGTLISERFVLTAGHCLASAQYGEVTYAFIGALYRSEVNNPAGKYKIKSILKHPDYHSPKKYNDIALLKLDRSVVLNNYTIPACLPVGDQYNIDKVVATGWGLTAYKGDTSRILQKVDLTKFPTNECSENFPPDRNIEKGFDANTQMCYGDKEESKDTCQGDSGGPLQIRHPKIDCMYLIVGVTSGGYACGFVGQPALYTKVSQYVPWIESVVWP